MVRAVYRSFTGSYQTYTLNVDSIGQNKMLDYTNATIVNVPLTQQPATTFTKAQNSVASFYLPSSSPIKRLSKKSDPCNLENTEHYDLSGIQCVFDSEKCKNFISKEFTELCTVDKKVDGYLQKLTNEGVCDLGLEDVSYGIKSSPIKYSLMNETTGVKVVYFYTSLQTEAVIGIPKSNSSKTTREHLVAQISEVMINSQTGKVKVKVVILTPRNDASWLQRKISTAMFPAKSGYDYIIVRIRKSFTKTLKACISELIQS